MLYEVITFLSYLDGTAFGRFPKSVRRIDRESVHRLSRQKLLVTAGNRHRLRGRRAGRRARVVVCRDRDCATAVVV